MSAVKIVKFVLMVILLLWVCIVAVTNNYPIAIKLLPFGGEKFTLPSMPLSLVIFIAFLLGVLLAGFYGLIEVLKQTRKVRKLSKKNSMLEKEISNLRDEPIVVNASEEDKDDEYPDSDPPIDEDTLKRIR